MCGIAGVVAPEGLFLRSGICRWSYEYRKFLYGDHLSAGRECPHFADSREPNTETEGH